MIKYMSRFIESIRLENGIFFHLPLHQRRLNQTRQVFFPSAQAIDLISLVGAMAARYRQGLFKCRIVYGEDIEDIQFIPYQIRPIVSLKLVFDDQINYSHKALDRSKLKGLVKPSIGCDDIAIIKEDRITDTSYCNILFLDHDQWVTPTHPLLGGIQREYLLSSGRIIERDILIDDIFSFSHIKLINAMIPFEQAQILPISALVR